MSRRDQKLTRLQRQFAAAQEGKAGAYDPLAGVAPHLEATFLTKATTWWNGFDGYHSADRVFVHRDGHHTAHTGPCSVPIAEDLLARITRQAGLDRDEAALARDVAAHPGDRDHTASACSRRLGWPERTTRRRLDRLREKLAHLRLTERDLGAA